MPCLQGMTFNICTLNGGVLWCGGWILSWLGLNWALIIISHLLLHNTRCNPSSHTFTSSTIQFLSCRCMASHLQSCFNVISQCRVQVIVYLIVQTRQLVTWSSLLSFYPTTVGRTWIPDRLHKAEMLPRALNRGGVWSCQRDDERTFLPIFSSASSMADKVVAKSPGASIWLKSVIIVLDLPNLNSSARICSDRVGTSTPRFSPGFSLSSY